MRPASDPVDPDLTAHADVPADVPWHCPPFAPALERAFLRDGERIWLRLARNWLLLVAGLGAAMVWAAGLSGRSAVLASVALQGLVGLPVALLARSLLGRVPRGDAREAVFGASALAVLFCTTATGWWASAAYADRYVMAGGLGLITALILVPLRLRRSALLGAAGVVLVAATSLLPPGQPMRAHWDIVVFSALLLPLGLRVRAGAERDARRLFLMRRREEAGRRALARANARLREMSETDPMTGLANRRRFDGALHDALESDGRGAALLLLDVDHFKRLNDALGHAEGDTCLRAVAATLRAQVRGRGDLAARIGGEEFAVLLPGAAEAEAIEVAERIRAAVEVLLLPHPGRPEPPRVVTLSAGVATAVRQEGADSLMRRADAALYAAKSGGRNRVRAAPEVRPPRQLAG